MLSGKFYCESATVIFVIFVDNWNEIS